MDTTYEELTDFLAIHLYMGILRLPFIKDYWFVNFRVNQITSHRSRNRFLQLRHNLHFIDNTTLDSDCTDRFFEIRPPLNFVLQACMSFYDKN